MTEEFLSTQADRVTSVGQKSDGESHMSTISLHPTIVPSILSQPLTDRSDAIDASRTAALRDPNCHGMQELSDARRKRSWVRAYLNRSHPVESPGATESKQDEGPHQQGIESDAVAPTSPLFQHLSLGLALTVGSALGSTPPSTSTCLSAFLLPNTAGLTAGARAWSKHAPRSQPRSSTPSQETNPEAPGLALEASAQNVSKGKKTKKKKGSKEDEGWWGRPSGPVKLINERALELFWRIAEGATWRNLHWLPHQVLVYEIRVEEGYGMRWSQDQSGYGGIDKAGNGGAVGERPWVFRGFVEPMMENGHEVGWRHPVHSPES